MRRSTRARRPNDKVVPKYFALKGGLNLVDAPITMPNGMVLAAVNYELLSREGYRRIDGFERFDGQTSPSDASYWILSFDAQTAALSEGDQVTGVTSGATGEALVDEVITAVVVNLGLDPEDVSGAAWGGTGAGWTESLNVANSPEGTLTVDRIGDATAVAAESMQQIITVDGTKAHTVSVFIKKDTDVSRFPLLAFRHIGATIQGGHMCINTKTGQFDFETENGATITNEQVENYDDDFWRASFTVQSTDTSLTTTIIQMYPAFSDLFDASVAVASAQGTVDVWGFNLTESTVLQPYHATGSTFGYYVLTDVDGTFVDGETLAVAGGSDEFTFEFSSEYA